MKHIIVILRTIVALTALYAGVYVAVYCALLFMSAIIAMFGATAFITVIASLFAAFIGMLVACVSVPLTMSLAGWIMIAIESVWKKISSNTTRTSCAA